MKRMIPVLLVMLLLLSAANLTRLRSSANAKRATIVVPDDYPTIQAAINAANPSDTIFVREGTHHESVEVNKTVSLIGEDVDNTIIDGQGADFIISVTVGGASIRGFTIMRGVTSQSSYGIRVDTHGSNIIRENKIIGMPEGIGILLYSSDNVVSDNTILASTKDGIQLYYSDNNIVSNNTITNNSTGTGLNLYVSSSNAFSGNSISNCTVSVSLTSFSNYNTFYHNNFYNPAQVAKDVVSNFWDFQGEGNFWSDYNGTDPDHDGIGNTPYRIGSGNQDDSPLMGTFVSFDIALASETYETTIISNSTVSNFRFEVGPETGNRIMQFDVMGEDGSSGFARVAVPLKLMNYSLIVFIGEQEVVPVVLSVSDRTQTYLYLTYFHSNLTISITSSKTLSSYNDLLNKFLKLQTDFNNLSMTYNSLINNYSISLQEALQNLNNSYSELLDNYTAVLDRYNELQLEYQALKAAYEDNVQNTRNLMYIFAGMAATLILAVLYLSRRGTPQKIRAQERKE